MSTAQVGSRKRSEEEEEVVVLVGRGPKLASTGPVRHPAHQGPLPLSTSASGTWPGRDAGLDSTGPTKLAGNTVSQLCGAATRPPPAVIVFCTALSWPAHTKRRPRVGWVPPCLMIRPRVGAQQAFAVPPPSTHLGKALCTVRPVAPVTVAIGGNR